MADRTTALSLRADRARNHLSDLVDNLQRQVTPTELVEQLTGGQFVIDGGAGLARAITEQVKKNPIACLLIAAGVGWLMASEKTQKNRPSPRRLRIARRAGTTRKRRSSQKKKAA